MNTPAGQPAPDGCDAAVGSRESDCHGSARRCAAQLVGVDGQRGRDRVPRAPLDHGRLHPQRGQPGGDRRRAPRPPTPTRGSPPAPTTTSCGRGRRGRQRRAVGAGERHRAGRHDRADGVADLARRGLDRVGRGRRSRRRRRTTSASRACSSSSTARTSARADTTAPYDFSWDTRTASNAPHSLTAVAVDAAGNQTTSPTVSVTVNNPTGTAGLVAAYGFEEASGTTTADQTGLGHTGTLSGAHALDARQVRARAQLRRRQRLGHGRRRERPRPDHRDDASRPGSTRPPPTTSGARCRQGAERGPRLRDDGHGRPRGGPYGIISTPDEQLAPGLGRARRQTRGHT